ncbi:Pyruvate oxidase [ubiquinone, cytochrome] [Pseudonocardia sp. Ae168_Ps1]|nr:Pyruvate oxidase [ubiquinone, cytochrome] [Pseudonocardia sp. Ae150A_Ps1]OLL82055.1 Pyruvate oxidase [ubiquinone, cytochrome] [Pseudonocardia sp. Ae168_Ps1]OLL83832.1 Pyruvate oxidase [ubiquinone, cytochrome] [Pseudonocardia sp. Ae263_Ps1]OLL90127.1 Pyruvate oxidase [ubiquinone, cytochrome] [Pseudonocardia sp. Ae356_Ps1]
MPVSRTVADQMIELLHQAGVERIYGLVGDSLNPLADAIRRDGRIRWVHVHNEEGAALAAAAEAQLTGRLAVCAGSCGPGNTHLVQGLYDAHRTGAPVLAIASHIPSVQIGTGYFQETHPEHLFAECSGYCELISRPEQMPRMQRMAMQSAIARRDVSVLVLPGDVSAEPATHDTGHSDLVTPSGTVVPDPAKVDELARLVDGASSVTLFVGAGIAGARDEVLALAGAVQAPIGHSLGGKEWIQYDNPYDVGMSGLLGYGACYEATHEADLLILIGTDFPYDDFLPQARTVQIDAEAAHLGRRTVLELGVHGDARSTLAALLPRITARTDRSFLDRMLRRHAEALEKVVGAYTRKVSDLRPIHPEHVADVLDDEMADDAIATVDTGMCNVWAARYLTPNGRRRIIGSYRHGTMANALPHAIGAASAFPGRQVVSLSGDGGLTMLLGELLTAVEHGLPLTVVAYNNGSLGMIRLEMMVAGYPSFQTDHGPADLAGIARAAGAHAVTVEDPDHVRPALRTALDHDGPSLVDVRTDPNALSIPPHVTAAQVRGFALAATRTVLDGGVGKMIELARSNLRSIPRP